jgi:hypothetical protein
VRRAPSQVVQETLGVLQKMFKDVVIPTPVQRVAARCWSAV